MPKETTEPVNSSESRRSFLGKLAVGVAALAIMGAPFFRLGRGNAAQSIASSDGFPDEDSIFHPAQDPRLDPRRNNRS